MASDEQISVNMLTHRITAHQMYPCLLHRYIEASVSSVHQSD